MLKLLIEIKINIITAKYFLILLAQYLLLTAIAILCDRLIEFITCIPLFFYYTKKYDKQYHCKTLLKCALTTIIIFSLVCILIPSKNEFIFISIIFTYLLTTISFYVRDYLDKNIKTTFYKGMNADELPNDLSGVEYDIMNLYYVERRKLDYIAYAVNYSVDNVKKLKAKILKRYS